MKQLELKHIAPYLPYKVKAITADKCVFEVEGIYTFGDIYSSNMGDIPFYCTKLILRPMSDLVKEIEINGKKFVPLIELKTGGTNRNEVHVFENWDGTNYVCCDNEDHELRFSVKNGFDRSFRGESRQLYSYDLFQKLFEWHFDVFGLIADGLAVDYNTVEF
jgi:hypothetical protein